MDDIDPADLISQLKTLPKDNKKILQHAEDNIDLSKEDEKRNPLFFVNPEITFKSKELVTYEEGCLSIPNQFAEVKRPSECKINFLDYNGKKDELHAKGLLATCIQHEIDHLNGILFIDHLSKLKKDLILKKTKKQKKEIDRVVV